MPVELLLLLFSPVFFLVMLAEFIKRRKYYHVKDSINNIVLAALHQASDAISLLLLMPFFVLLHEFSIFSIEYNVFNIFLAFVVQDFLYYWFHRASHHIHWLWAAHVVHHSSRYMNFSTAFRQSIMYPIVGMWIFWLPMILIGYGPTLVFTIVSLNLAFQFFVHTQWVGKLGWLEKVFNTPSHHRVHHAINADYIDKNFAGVLIVWDKMFGTFQSERADIETRYGIIGKLPEHNPISANFHQWRYLLSQFEKAPSLRTKLGVLFGYPTHEK